MTQLGYGPDKRLAIKVAARSILTYRDPAIILIDQLKDIWIDGELEPIETANWFPKDYQIGLNNTGSGVDDPDQQFFENYGCGSERNYTGYCNAELEKQFVAQSLIADHDKRRHLHAAASQRADRHGQQSVQRLAHGRRLARPLTGPGDPGAIERQVIRDRAADRIAGCRRRQRRRGCRSVSVDTS
jgi:hypothetical protein